MGFPVIFRSISSQCIYLICTFSSFFFSCKKEPNNLKCTFLFTNPANAHTKSNNEKSRKIYLVDVEANDLIFLISASCFTQSPTPAVTRLLLDIGVSIKRKVLTWPFLGNIYLDKGKLQKASHERLNSTTDSTKGRPKDIQIDKKRAKNIERETELHQNMTRILFIDLLRPKQNKRDKDRWQ